MATKKRTASAAPKRKSARSDQQVASMELAKKVWELRLRGFRVSEIAAKLGKPYTTIHSSLRRYMTRLAQSITVDVERERQMELERIDLALQRVMEAVEAGNLSAVMALDKLLARRARYLPGVEAPQDHNLNVNLTPDQATAALLSSLGVPDAAEDEG
jgi:hypothetical protein